MKTENIVLMRMARESLTGKWGLAIGAFVIFFIVLAVASIIPLASFFLIPPLSLGFIIFSLSIARGEDAKIDQLFQGFNNFGRILGAYWLVALFTLLWMLLLIIPGIIASLSYSMTFYILADDDSISAMDAIKKSKQMMDGYKMKYFGLGLLFFLLSLLCLLTLGIGFLWLAPYAQVTVAKFYEDVKADYASKTLSLDC